MNKYLLLAAVAAVLTISQSQASENKNSDSGSFVRFCKGALFGCDTMISGKKGNVFKNLSESTRSRAEIVGDATLRSVVGFFSLKTALTGIKQLFGGGFASALLTGFRFSKQFKYLEYQKKHAYNFAHVLTTNIALLGAAKTAVGTFVLNRACRFVENGQQTQY